VVDTQLAAKHGPKRAVDAIHQPLRRFSGGAQICPMKKAFTLIEVLVVVAIVCLLLAVVIGAIGSAKNHSSKGLEDNAKRFESYLRRLHPKAQSIACECTSAPTGVLFDSTVNCTGVITQDGKETTEYGTCTPDGCGPLVSQYNHIQYTR